MTDHYLDLADLAIRERDYTEAAARLQRAAEMAPGDLRVLRLRAEVLLSQGDY